MALVVVTGTDVRNAVRDALKDEETGLPQVLLDLAAVKGLDPLKPVKSWNVLPDFKALKDSQSPCVVVTSPGLDGEPGAPTQPRMSLKKSAAWVVQVHTVVRGQSYEEVADLVGHYTAAIRVAVLRNRTLGGLASTTRWTAEDYRALDVDQARTVGAGYVEFVTSIDTAIDPAT